jgi:hypothetical protein
MALPSGTEVSYTKKETTPTPPRPPSQLPSATSSPENLQGLDHRRRQIRVCAAQLALGRASLHPQGLGPNPIPPEVQSEISEVFTRLVSQV